MKSELPVIIANISINDLISKPVVIAINLIEGKELSAPKKSANSKTKMNFSLTYALLFAGAVMQYLFQPVISS